MQAFYQRLDLFLFEQGFEDSMKGLGCSDAELAALEQQHGGRLPLAYRLFLQWCGHATLQSLEYDCRFDSLRYSWDSARELLAENHATLAPNAFVFGEWQGYNFFYFLSGVENPPVK
jgi:hypothetical protein